MAYKSSYDAETAILEYERELQEAIKQRGIIEQAMTELRRKKLAVELEINEKQGPLRMARENIKRLESEISITKTEFWRLKHEGL